MRSNHPRMLVVGDGAGWAIDEEKHALQGSITRLGYRQNQSRFVPSDLAIYMDRYLCFRDMRLHVTSLHKNIALSYFHGDPSSSPSFKALLERLQSFSRRISRIRVSNQFMRSVLESSGFSERVQVIPIGVDSAEFTRVSGLSRQSSRNALGVSADTLLLGSFQKDGAGFARDPSPKLIKGPDLLVATLRKVKKEYENLTVLLVGPSREYVKRGLDQSKIAYIHLESVRREVVQSAYHALDGYLITSREEGGPKGFLESYASGIPVISTPVGQVVDILGKESQYLAASFDPEHIAETVCQFFSRPITESYRDEIRGVAERHDFQQLDSEWESFIQESVG